MDKQISFTDFIRLIVFFALSSISYLFFVNSFYELIGPAQHTGSFLLSFLLVDCVSPFISLLISLFVVRNKWKPLAATLFMYILFFLIVCYDIFINSYEPLNFGRQLCSFEFFRYRDYVGHHYLDTSVRSNCPRKK